VRFEARLVVGGDNHRGGDDARRQIIAGELDLHVHDLNAAILNQLGIDHTRLTFKFQGRYFHLTDVHGEVVRKILV